MMTSNNIIDVSEADFDTLVIEYSYQIPVVVDFWAEWCGPCKVLGPLLEKLATESGGAFRLARVNVDDNQNLALRFGVHSIPAVKAFKGGKVVAEFVGAQPEPRVREFLQKIAPNPYDLLLEKGQSLIGRQQWREAEQTLLEVLKQDSDNPSALLEISKCYLMEGRSTDALKILSGFPASKEYQSAELLLSLAVALEELGKDQPDEVTPIEAAFINALRLIKRGNLPAAMDGLLDILREDKHFNQDRPRIILLSLFEILGEDSELTRQYRQELASILF